MREVDSPIRPAKVMYAGLDEWSSAENEVLSKLGLRRTSSKELADSPGSILQWIEAEAGDFLAGVPRDRLEPAHIIRLLQEVGEACHIVGLAITEYISWGALQTQQGLLAQLPLVQA